MDDLKQTEIMTNSSFKTPMLVISFKAWDCQDVKSFFPITMALWRNGLEVLYSGNEPGLRQKFNYLDDLTDSYIVTKRREGWVGAGKKECWVLPITGEKYLKAFLIKDPSFGSLMVTIYLWGIKCDPGDFPKAQYAGSYAMSTPGVVMPSPEKRVLPFSQSIQDKDKEIEALKAKVDKFDQNLDVADELSKDVVDELQKERKKAHNRANVIIQMTEVANKRNEKVQRLIQSGKAQTETISNLLHQIDKVLDRVHVKEKSKNVLHEANIRLKERLEEFRKSTKPRYEVEASRDISLSSFKMSTTATAIRWLCAASMVGFLAYMLV